MPENEFAGTTFAGSGLRRFEGLEVTIRVGGPTPVYYPRERTASGRARISGGAFRLEFPEAREVELYKPFMLYFDVNGDGKCTSGIDEGYSGATEGGSDTYLVAVEESSIFPRTDEDCRVMDGPWMD